MAQTVTVSGVDDPDVDGDMAYTILTAPATGAAEYVGIDAADVSVTNVDNEVAPGVTVSSIAPNSMDAGSTIMNVMISGSGFAAGASVTFANGQGPAPSANVVDLTSTTITANVSAGGGGPNGCRIWDVVVTNPGGSSGTLIDGFGVAKNGECSLSTAATGGGDSDVMFALAVGLLGEASAGDPSSAIHTDATPLTAAQPANEPQPVQATTGTLESRAVDRVMASYRPLSRGHKGVDEVELGFALDDLAENALEQSLPVV